LKEKSSFITVETSFIEPELVALSAEKLEEYGKDEKMKEWKRVFDEIVRFKPHTLSDAEEKVFLMLNEFVRILF
jgi:oligoendopeptidase F